MRHFGLEAVPNGLRQFDEKDTEVITVTFDGKEYPVKNATMPTTRAYKRIDGGFEFVTRVNGKITITKRTVASADGKTLTTVQTGTDDQGRTVNNLMIREKTVAGGRLRSRRNRDRPDLFGGACGPARR